MWSGNFKRPALKGIARLPVYRQVDLPAGRDVIHVDETPNAKWNCVGVVSVNEEKNNGDD
jgi:hypothetical protein